MNIQNYFIDFRNFKEPNDKNIIEKVNLEKKLSINSSTRKSVKKPGENEWYDALCRGEKVSNWLR